MRQTERANDLQEALRAMLRGFQANIWTATPGIVQSYNAVQGTVVVQVAIQANITDLDTGAVTPTTIDLLRDVPVCYLGGGGMVATFPIQQGDTALVIFASRSISAWWQNGGVQKQTAPRMHSLSDGFAFIGPRSLANSIPNVSTTTAQFRSLDGSTFVEIASGQVVNIVAPGGANITGSLSVNGNVSITGTATATGEVEGNGIKLSTHTHSGVTSGGGTSGPPVP
jgi:hypothetical protein